MIGDIQKNNMILSCFLNSNTKKIHFETEAFTRAFSEYLERSFVRINCSWEYSLSKELLSAF